MTTWLLAYAPLLALGLALLVSLRRQVELRSFARSHRELRSAKERGSDRARLQHPDIDLSKCIGCGTCVKACPEEGVLSLLHGQAVIVHGARCVGHGLCAQACPTGAIALTLGDLSDRRDLPALDENLEAVGLPGLFLAGEIGGFALVRTAISQGTAVADAVASRVRSASLVASRAAPSRVAVGAAVGRDGPPQAPGDGPADAVDLLIVGAGPGGLACSLRAAELGLSYLTIEQEERIGGTVAAYPRRKLVMTQPVELPLHGRLPRLSYQKEELIELWEDVARRHRLPIWTGVRLVGLQRDEDGTFAVETTAGPLRARNVCLALGRRGTPRRLGVPGEDLPKVAYSLLDAESYKGRAILVVGGGDSAIEAALALSRQPGNRVTLSYRKADFFRLKARNERLIREALARGELEVQFRSQVAAIESDRVRLRLESGEEREFANDEVFIFAGGEPPFPLLEKAGVSFDPADRPPPKATAPSRDLLLVLSLVLVAAIATAWWASRHWGYYRLPIGLRGAAPDHDMLRPGGPVGLAAGVLACLLFACNLAYLLRRSQRLGQRIRGSLRAWMNLHVLTGLFAFLVVLVHSGFSWKDTVGGHAFLALTVVVLTGAIGRYLYAFVPRAANGAAVDLEEVRRNLAAVSSEWDQTGRGFGTWVRRHTDKLIDQARWRPTLAARLIALIRSQWRLRRLLKEVATTARREGIPTREAKRMLGLARRAHRLTLLVTHYEEVRALLASWRYLHRWIALLLVILVILHVVAASRFASMDWSWLWPVGGAR